MPTRLSALVAAAVVSACATAPPSAVVLEPGFDRFGGDYHGFDLAEPDPGLCANACVMDVSCRAFAYVKPGVAARTARCFKKNVRPERTPNNDCTSGVVR